MFRSLVALQVPRRCQDGLFAFVMHVQTIFRAHGTAESAQVIGNMSDAIVSIFACRILGFKFEGHFLFRLVVPWANVRNLARMMERVKVHQTLMVLPKHWQTTRCCGRKS